MACVESCVVRFASNTTVCKEFCYVFDACPTHISLPSLLLCTVFVFSILFCIIGAAGSKKNRLERPPSYGTTEQMPAPQKDWAEENLMIGKEEV